MINPTRIALARTIALSALALAKAAPPARDSIGMGNRARIWQNVDNMAQALAMLDRVRDAGDVRDVLSDVIRYTRRIREASAQLHA